MGEIVFVTTAFTKVKINARNATFLAGSVMDQRILTVEVVQMLIMTSLMESALKISHVQQAYICMKSNASHVLTIVQTANLRKFVVSVFLVLSYKKQ